MALPKQQFSGRSEESPTCVHGHARARLECMQPHSAMPQDRQTFPGKKSYQGVVQISTSDSYQAGTMSGLDLDQR